MICPVCLATIDDSQQSCPKCKTTLIPLRRSQELPASFYNRALRAAAAGNWADAVVQAAAAAGLAPSDDELRAFLACCFIELERPEVARHLLAGLTDSQWSTTVADRMPKGAPEP